MKLGQDRIVTINSLPRHSGPQEVRGRNSDNTLLRKSFDEPEVQGRTLAHLSVDRGAMIRLLDVVGERVMVARD
jgi:hypothetical protein